MRRQTLLALLIMFFIGCVFHSSPKDYRESYLLSRISELAGVYKNKGDPSGALSQIIWGDMNVSGQPEGIHKDIELIEVSADKEVLIVKGIKGRCVIHEKAYINGRDFKIHNGKIVIDRALSLLAGEVGDVLVGPIHHTVTLGLDAGKHGQYRDSTNAIGLVFMIWPTQYSATTDIRFERVKDRSLGYKACK